MSLESAYELLSQIVKMYCNHCNNGTPSYDSFEAFKWLVEEIIQLHVKFRLPCFSRPFGIVIDEGTGIGCEELFCYLVSLHNETRVQIRLGVNNLHLALYKGHLGLAKRILETNLMTLDYQKPALKGSSLIVAIKADSLSIVSWVSAEIGFRKTCKVLRKYQHEGLIKSFSMYLWLRDVLTPRMQPKINLMKMVDVDHLFSWGGPNDSALIVSHLLHPIDGFPDFYNFIHYLSRVNPQELRSAWSPTKAYGWNIHLWYALAMEDLELSASLLAPVTVYSMDMYWAYVLVTRKGNLDLFKLVHQTMHQLDMSQSSDRYVSIVENICVFACQHGHLAIFDYLLSNCQFLNIEYIKRLALTSARRKRTKALELCLNLLNCKLDSDYKQELLTIVIGKNDLPSLELVLDRFHMDLTSSALVTISRAVLSKNRAAIFQRSWRMVRDCLNAVVQSLSRDTLSWLWFKGYDEAIRDMNLGALVLRENIQVIMFLINTLGHTLVDEVIQDCRGTWTSIDMVHYKIYALGESFNSLDSNVFKLSNKASLGFCLHKIDSDYAQWVRVHPHGVAIPTSKIRKHVATCKQQSASSGCCLSLLTQPSADNLVHQHPYVLQWVP